MPPLLQRMPSGKMVNVLDLEPAMVDVQDIAHNLSHQCRFNGGTRDHYSVAQHSIYVAERVWYLVEPVCVLDDAIRITKRALMHDASEAYLGDVVRPLKYTDPFVEYRIIENRTQALIELVLGLHLDDDESAEQERDHITTADNAVLALECQQLFTPAYYPQREYGLSAPQWWRPIDPWPAGSARERFLQCWQHPAVYFSVHGFFNQLHLPWRNDT